MYICRRTQYECKKGIKNNNMKKLINRLINSLDNKQITKETLRIFFEISLNVEINKYNTEDQLLDCLFVTISDYKNGSIEEADLEMILEFRISKFEN